MWPRLRVAGPQQQRTDLPLVGNNVPTSSHTQRTRYLYTESSNGRLTWDAYQQETLSIMIQVVYRGQTLDWLPIVVSVFDDLGAIKRTLKYAPKPSDGAFRILNLEVQWKTDGTETIAGMRGDIWTRLYDHSVAAILHKLKQRSGLDSVLVTIVDAPVPVIDRILEDSPEEATSGVPRGARNNSSSSKGKAPQGPPAQSERPPNKARKVSTASTSQKVAKSSPASTFGNIEGSESAGASNQALILREKSSTVKHSTKIDHAGSKDKEQYTIAKRKRQDSPVSEFNDASQQANTIPSKEGRDRRPYDPVRDVSGQYTGPKSTAE